MLTILNPFRRTEVAVLALTLAVALTACTPPGPKALLEGERLLKAGHPAEAVPRLKAAVEFLPGNAQAWNHLGLAYHMTRQTAPAVQAYQQAIRLDRNLAPAHLNLGSLWLEENNAPLAIQSLQSFVRLQPSSAEGWRKLGQAHLRLKQWDHAERSLSTALRLEPRDAETLNGLGLVNQQHRRFREAWQYFSGAIQVSPQFAPAWLNLGVAAQQAGARPQAIQAYRQFALLRPESAKSMGLETTLQALMEPPPSAATTPATLPAPVPATTEAAPREGQVVERHPPASPLPGLAAANQTTLPETSRPPANRQTAPPERTSVAAPEPRRSTSPPPVVVVPPETRPSSPTSAVASSTPATVFPPAARFPVLVMPSPVVRHATESTGSVSPPATPESSRIVAAPSPTPRAPATNLVVFTTPPSRPATEPATEPTPLVRPVSERRDFQGDTRGFWSWANPTTWFRGKTNAETAEAETTIPGMLESMPQLSESNPHEVRSVAMQSASGDRAPALSGRNPVSATRRYRYLHPSVPAAGDPASARVLMNEAVVEHRRGRLETALRLYETALQRDPALYEAYQNSAAAYLTLGDLPKALASGEMALTLKPEANAARLNFALALDAAGFPTDAALEAERIVATSPDDVPAHLLLGNLYARQLANPTQAALHYRKVIERQPGHPQSVAIRHWLADHG